MAFSYSDRGSLLQAPPNLYKVLLAFSEPLVAYVVVGIPTCSSLPPLDQRGDDSTGMMEWAEILGCKVGSMPSSYLGIKVGMNHHNTAEWREIVQKIRNRVKRWESNKISFGGRIILVNAVLSYLPTYYLLIELDGILNLDSAR
ncbi:hypothetical protein ACS0TY_003903 [Phlomoides rotata]